MDRPKQNLTAGIALLVAVLALGAGVAALTLRRGDNAKEMEDRINTIVQQRFDAEKARLGSEISGNADKSFKAPPEKLKKLLQEVLTTQQRACEAAHISFDRGLKSGEDVLQAERAVMNTQLELCASKDERMKVYADMLQNLAKYEKLTEARFNAGQLTQLDVLLAKNERLLIEIRMEREKE